MTELIGQTLGPYRIIEQIGMGGMATVYKAYQASVDRYVAVKVLPRQFAEDPSFIGRFEQEARTIAKLEHPHILPVHDYGEQEGITYLVMRFVGAGTLKDLMAERGPMSLDETLRIMEQIGGALGYAHSQGVIHRDIKPSNVLVDPRGDCFLTDFGIARLVEGTTEFTATGRIVGTPAYMAPEQGMGEKADARSDIYALGIILYEMVTGKVPYQAETPLAVLMKHVTAPLPLPRQIKPDLPESVERVILKALSKSPDDRFQRVEDMITALRQAVTSPEAVAAEPAAPPVWDEATAVVDQAPPTKTVPATTPRRPFPWLPLIAGGAAILLVLAVAAALVLTRLLSSPEGTASPPAEVAVSPTEPPGAEVAAEPAVPSADLEPGWTVFISGDDVWALAAQGETIWAGGSGGLLRWDRASGSYEQFTAADGLASNFVNVLLVDPKGILWVGTEEGLSRYDPTTDRWTTFDVADGLDSNTVVSLYYDDEENVLVAGTAYGDRGLNVYDGTEWRAPDIPPIPIEFPAPRVLLNADGVFVAGLSEGGVAFFDGEGWQIFGVDPDYPEAGVNDLYLTREGELLAATDWGVLRLDTDAESWDVIPQLDGFPTNAILEDSGGLLWFAGEGGVFRFDPGVGDWEFTEAESDELPAWSVTAVVEDEDGGLWFGLAGGGLSRFQDGEWQVWAVGGGLAGNAINSIVEDRGGNLWVTFDGGGGISRYSPATDTWEVFTEEDGALNWPSPPAVDREGRVWIGGWASARFFDGERWHTFENDALGEHSVWAITQDESGGMWFGTEGSIVRFDPGDGSAQVFTGRDGLPDGGVWQLSSARDGLILATVGDKLMVFDGTGWRREFPDHDEVYQITKTPSGEVWVAGGDRLFVYDGEVWDTIRVPDSLWITALSVAPDGTVWAGSWDKLAHFDPESHTWEDLEPGGGTLPNAVTAVLVAHDGAVWVGTPGGLGRYVPQ